MRLLLWNVELGKHNPPPLGRYVSVVIEEDGKTEEEFIGGLAEMQAALKTLDTEATELSPVVRHNPSNSSGTSEPIKISLCALVPL